MPRLLAITSVWPSAEHPSAGIFVANRFRGVRGVKVVVDPRSRQWPWRLVRFISLGLRAGSRFDGVEAHILYTAGFVALVVARIRGLPLVAYAHGTDVREYFNWGRGYRFFVRQVVRHADLLVTNSEDTASYIRRIGGDPVVIPPGYDDDLFRPAPRRPEAARRVLYLGGTTPRKGYDVAQRHADTLVGPGLQEAEPVEVARLIVEHDVVLMPSHAEPFGLVAAEAIGSGRWVVARDVGGLRDIVIDGVNGTLVSDDDWAGALSRVPDYDPMAVAGTVHQFALARWQERMAAAWEDVLAARHGRRRRER
jgi:glycosyltransferase involved in cell wall biosynthesis